MHSVYCTAALRDKSKISPLIAFLLRQKNNAFKVERKTAALFSVLRLFRVFGFLLVLSFTAFDDDNLCVLREAKVAVTPYAFDSY